MTTTPNEKTPILPPHGPSTAKKELYLRCFVESDTEAQAIKISMPLRLLIERVAKIVSARVRPYRNKSSAQKLQYEIYFRFEPKSDLGPENLYQLLPRHLGDHKRWGGTEEWNIWTRDNMDPTRRLVVPEATWAMLEIVV